MALLVPSFVAAYLAGVLGLIWFDLHVLGLGDPKFTSVFIYFPLWSVGLAPAVIFAVVFLWRSTLRGWHLWRLGGVYLALILVTLQISFALDIDWVIQLEFAATV